MRARLEGRTLDGTKYHIDGSSRADTENGMTQDQWRSHILSFDARYVAANGNTFTWLSTNAYGA